LGNVAEKKQRKGARKKRKRLRGRGATLKKGGGGRRFARGKRKRLGKQGVTEFRMAETRRGGCLVKPYKIQNTTKQTPASMLSWGIPAEKMKKKERRPKPLKTRPWSRQYNQKKVRGDIPEPAGEENAGNEQYW